MTSSAHTTVLNSAAQSLEERALIGRIADNPTDALAREQYSRWLEQRSDRRLPFSQALAEFVGEFNAASEQCPILFSSASGLSRAWSDMLGYPLFRGIKRHDELWNVKEIVFRYAKPTLKIIPELVAIGGVPLQGSRFGGQASLPPDLPWPTCSAGPLQFLGQIALGEISLTQVARELPSSGWLSFFAHDEWGSVGASSDDRDTQVIYVAGDQELVWRETPQEIVERLGSVAPPCRLIFTESWDFPDEKDLIVAEADQNRLTGGDKWIDLRGTVLGDEAQYSCHLLGYPRHFRTSDPSPSPDWRNLLCLSSIDSLCWNWCDGEHLAILIPNEQLEAHQFDRVFGYAS